MKLHKSSVKFFLGFLLLSLVPSSMAKYVVKKNSLSVISPDKMKGRHDSAIGDVGIPQYGGRLVGGVVYPKDNQKGCKDFHEFGITYKSRPGDLPAIFLLDRGDCFFALKVWRAQKAGAAAVLLADDIKEPLITMYVPEEEDSYDMYAEHITIPSALIEKSFGETIKKAISGGHIVIVNLDWREAAVGDGVEYELRTNSTNECGVKCDMMVGRTSESIAGKTASEGRYAWTAFWAIIVGLALTAGGAYLAYKHRIKRYMDSEMEAIMAQYKPLDS